MHQSDSIVIIPTYNEKENIEKIVRAIFDLDKCFHILVIDDGSPDGTAAIVRGMMAMEFGDRLNIIERSGKLGLGTAYITGFKWALEHDYEYVFEMDADQGPAQTVCRLSRRGIRCGCRKPICKWRECRRLACRACTDELFRIEVCETRHRL